jgi:riboflavin transporter FmnP
MSNYLRLKKMLYVVSLAAVSIVLGLVEITWPVPGASFLKLDFSEVAILVALIVLGTKETFFVVLIRSLARRLFNGFSPDGLVGEMIAMFASFAIIIAYNLSRKVLKLNEKPLIYEVSMNGNEHQLRETIVTTALIAVILTVILFALNFFITTPIYYTLPNPYVPVLSISGRLHFHVFSFIPDSPFSWGQYFWALFVIYIPFNLTKGILVSIVFMLLKPRIKYLEL